MQTLTQIITPNVFQKIVFIAFVIYMMLATYGKTGVASHAYVLGEMMIVSYIMGSYSIGRKKPETTST